MEAYKHNHIAYVTPSGRLNQLPIIMKFSTSIMLLADNFISHFIWLSRINEMPKIGLDLGGEQPRGKPRRPHKTERDYTDIIKMFTSLN
jgi:hypothetical protein